MDLAELGKTPIEESKPAGTDVRYEPEFESLQAEIDKLTSPTASGGVDWNKVVKTSAEILENKAKDILVASYLAIGLLQTKQVEGLATGLKIFADLLENFWDNLFPPKKRLRGRLAAIEWWRERTELALERLGTVSISPDLYEDITGSLGRLEKFFNDTLDEPPSLTSLARFIESRVEKPGEEEPKALEKGAETQEDTSPPPQAAPVSNASSPTAHATSPSIAPASETELSSPEDAKKQIKAAMQSIRHACKYLGDNNPCAPLPYRLRRISIWGLVENLPPASDGKTKIPPPPGQISNILSNLYAEQNWEGLLKAAEARIGEFVFWIDLHFYVAQSLNYMGPRYDKAYEVLCQETGFFISRFPKIQEMHFSDGTPFVSDAAKKWLNETGMGAASSPGIDSTLPEPTDSRKEDKLSEEIGKARSFVREKKLLDAITLIQDHMRKGASAREKLLWRLGLCQILIDGKKAFLAIPHLDQILLDIETYSLEKWEPELALSALKTAWIVFNGNTDQEAKKKAQEILARIARLDTAEAVRLKGLR